MANKLKNLKVNEVSFCVAGMNKHAKVALFKAKPSGPDAVIKATFQQALTGCLVADQVRDAFYDAFDNMYDGQAAFRTALIDELQAGGDGTTASAAYKAWLAGLVDTALTSAKASGAATLTSDDLNKAFRATASEWLETQQETTDMTITTLAALKAAIAKFDPTKSTVAERDEIHEAATTLKAEKELPAAGPLAKAAPPAENADLAKALREISVLKMAPDIRKHFDGLAETDQAAFLAKSAEDQAAEVAAKNSGDPIVHKMKDGTEIRKSDGATALIMAKALDAQTAQIGTLVDTIKSLTAENTEASIAKRAAEFKHLPNPTSIVKAHDALPEADRADYLATMRAADKAASGAFKSIGSSMVPADDEASDTPLGKMAAIVKRIATEEKISEPQATLKAVNDPEYKAAYAESVRMVRTA